MDFPKQLKDIVYKLLQEPTLDNFREFIRGQTGEHNSIDFKEQWLEKGKLAKEILAIANSGGGFIVFGVQENEDHSFTCKGLDGVPDKSDISNGLKIFFLPTLNMIFTISCIHPLSIRYLKEKLFRCWLLRIRPSTFLLFRLRMVRELKRIRYIHEEVRLRLQQTDQNYNKSFLVASIMNFHLMANH